MQPAHQSSLGGCESAGRLLSNGSAMCLMAAKNNFPCYTQSCVFQDIRVLYKTCTKSVRTFRPHLDSSSSTWLQNLDHPSLHTLREPIRQYLILNPRFGEAQVPFYDPQTSPIVSCTPLDTKCARYPRGRPDSLVRLSRQPMTAQPYHSLSSGHPIECLASHPQNHPFLDS